MRGNDHGRGAGRQRPVYNVGSGRYRRTVGTATTESPSYRHALPLAALFVITGLAAYSQPSAARKPGDSDWKSMFDGVSLKGWRETPFTGRGKVQVADGAIVLGIGFMTGVTWTGSFPKSNYEVRLDAMKVDGHDFFAGITFPVHDSHCSWINGGWGGGVVGLSSLDGMDASENDTTLQQVFETRRWYALRLRVTDDRIQAWIDNEPAIDEYIGDREVDLRPGEIELSRPFGIASYSTTAKLRKIEYRQIPPTGDGKGR